MGKRNKVFIGLFSIVILFGLYLVTSTSGRLAEKSLVSVRQMFASELPAEQKFHSKFVAESGWYKPEYTVPISDLEKASKTNLDKADASIKQAEQAKSAKLKRAYAEEAKKDVEAAQKAIKQAEEKLSAIKKSAADAWWLLDKTATEASEAAKSYGLAAERLATEGNRYLSKYADSNAKNLSDAKTKLGSVASDLEKISALLPVIGDSKQAGDPQKALDLLATTQQSVDSANLAVRTVINSLDFCKTAETLAAKTAEEAKLAILFSDGYIKGIADKGELSIDKALKKPNDDVDQAAILLKPALAALEIAVENGKYDYPLAYGNSLKAIEYAVGAIKETDRQLSLAKEAKKNIESLSIAITGFGKSIDEAQQYRDLLSYHAESAWAQAASNMKTARDNRQFAKESLVKAQKAAIEDQSFAVALAEIQNGNNALLGGANSLRALISLANTLESYRSAWPSEESRAQQAINDNESEIDSYGSYSSSAKSDFDSAEDYLARARSEAGSRLYGSAVSDAQEAYRLADGSGDTARQAYDDYQDSLTITTYSDFDSSSPSSSNSESSPSIDYGGSPSSSYGGGYESGSIGSDGGGMSSGSGSDGGGMSNISGNDTGGW